MSMPLFPTGPLTDAKLSPSLRPYQAKLIQRLRAHVIMGKKRIMVVAPCGAGKGVIAASVFRTSTVPCLFLCDRAELINQQVNQLQKQGLSSIGVIRADDERTNPSATIQVASILSLIRRDMPPAGIVIVDEAHIAASDSVREIFKFYSDSTIIGFTASPSRLDGRPLGGELFEVLEVAATYQELLKNPEWLVAPDVYAGPEPDLSQVGITGGDFNEDQLGSAMEPLTGDAVEHWLKLAHLHPAFTANGDRVPNRTTVGERRRTIAFCCNINHSMRVASEFEKAGVRVAHLDGTTPERERKAIVADLASGKLEVVTNCGIFIKGVDIPAVKCMVGLRPTQSLVIHIQTGGRLMRPWNNVVPLLLDHAGNFNRHGAPFEDRVWSLKDKVRRIAASFPMRLCRRCFAYVAASKMICIHCGTEFPPGEAKSPQQIAGELAQHSTEPMELRRKFFESMATLARAKGFKPGMAGVKFKERYGQWPPWSWSQDLNALFAQDQFWQEAMARRLKNKEIREAREAEEKRAMEAMPGDDDPPPEENDANEDFASYVDDVLGDDSIPF